MLFFAGARAYTPLELRHNKFFNAYGTRAEGPYYKPDLFVIGNYKDIPGV